ncbi:MAG: PQQ-dependent sugar dehydrogenase, partial [Gemmatimonadaceae bacterium]
VRMQRLGILVLVAGSAGSFALMWFLLSRWGIPSSRKLFVAAAILTIALNAVPLLVGRLRAISLAGLSLVALGLLIRDQRMAAPKPLPRDFAKGTHHSITLTRHPGLVPPARRPTRAGGALTRYKDGFLLATGSGEFYRLTWRPTGDSLRATRIETTSAYNLQEYLSGQHTAEDAISFRITDVLLDDRAGQLRLYLVHQRWNSEKRCLSMRVSATALTETASGGVEADAPWETIFESTPCLALGGSLPRRPNLETGGALVLHPQGLLLSLGDNTFEGLEGEKPFAQDTAVSYGKILLLDRAGKARIWSIGHRNPQGLLIDREGHVWSTEHGPDGGDELNLIVEGANYGWPVATYGVQYGMEYWPLAPTSLNHGAYREPAHAWVPAPGISKVIELGAKHFPMWEGDLLIGSLSRQTLYRVRKRGDQVIYVESMLIDARIRDLEQGTDGRIVFWTDAGEVLTASRAVRVLTGRSLYTANCAGCHEPPSPTATVGIAPPLRGVMGKVVASHPGYSYSNALRQLGGTWTADRMDKFLESPSTYAPGNRMEFGGVTDLVRRQELVKYLSTYK